MFKRDTTNYNYYSNAGGSNNQGNLSRTAVNNQINNNMKIHPSNTSNGYNQVFQPNVNVCNLKNDSYNNMDRENINNGGPSIVSSIYHKGHYDYKESLSENLNHQRLQPDILNAF